MALDQVAQNLLNLEKMALKQLALNRVALEKIALEKVAWEELTQFCIMTGVHKPI